MQGFNVNDERLLLRRNKEPNRAVIDEMLHLLALCHTVIPEGIPTEEGITYQALRV